MEDVTTVTVQCSFLEIYQEVGQSLSLLFVIHPFVDHSGFIKSKQQGPSFARKSIRRSLCAGLATPSFVHLSSFQNLTDEYVNSAEEILNLIAQVIFFFDPS